jgi:hypothetical protein
MSHPTSRPRRARAWLVDLLCALPVLVSAPVAAQQPIAPPVLKPFADNRQWVLVEDIRYRVGNSAFTIVVPKGFVTDFASIPQPFWALGLSPNGTYSRAAIVHDYLYWSQGCSRLQADNILVIAMKESNVEAPTRAAIFDGVRLGGSRAWLGNAGERADELPRVIPDDAMAFEANVLWPDYRRALQQRGVVDPPFAPAPDYCVVGDSTDVPGPSG